MNIFETQRFLLGHSAMGDLDDWFAFYSDPYVVKYIQMELEGKSEPIGVYVFRAAQHKGI